MTLCVKVADVGLIVAYRTMHFSRVNENLRGKTEIDFNGLTPDYIYTFSSLRGAALH